MKVALLTHGLETGGGVPAVARSLEKELRAQSDTVTMFDLATSRHDPQSRSLVHPGTWVTGPRIETRAGITHVGADLVELEPMRYRPRRSLHERLASYDVALVVAGTPMWVGPMRGSGLPVVLQIATRIAWERESRLPAMPLVKRWPVVAMTRYLDRQEARQVRLPKRVLVENRAMLEWVRGVGGAVELLPPGVDADYFRPAGSHEGHAGSFISVGRLGEARKGWDRLVAGYAAYRQRTGDSRGLTIVGKGDLSPSVYRDIRARGLESSIRILRDATKEELRTVLVQGSVFLQTSHEEGLGLAALEAMACGLPIVATDTAGAREYVGAKTGELVANQGFDPKEFADSLAAVVRNRASLGAGSRTCVETKFSETARGARFRQVLLEAVSSR